MSIMNLIKMQIPTGYSVDLFLLFSWFGDYRSLCFLCVNFGWRTFYFTRINMRYEKEELYETNIHCLRQIAREIGVQTPTVFKKKELINEIIKIESGTKQPATPSKKGRPLKHDLENRPIEMESGVVDSTAMSTEKNIKKQFIDFILKEIEKTLNELL